MIFPKALVPSDTVLLAATARPVEPLQLAPAIGFLESKGYRAELAPNMFSRHNVFAGDDNERLAGLQWALDHPTAAAIWFARGGYGTTRLLEKLDWTAFRTNPKWLIGFSDLTTLQHAAYARGVASVHGPLAFQAQGALLQDTEQLFAHLAGSPLPDVTLLPLAQNKPGEAGGTVLAANLSMLQTLLGTPDEADPTGCILFLEEVEEYYYKVDRMLGHLRRAGYLEKLAGLVVGSFSQIQDNPEPFGETLEQIVLRNLEGYSYPVAFGFPFGHAGRNHPLVLGSHCTLRVTETGANVRFEERFD